MVNKKERAPAGCGKTAPPEAQSRRSTVREDARAPHEDGAEAANVEDELLWAIRFISRAAWVLAAAAVGIAILILL